MAYLKLAASIADRARELPRCFNELPPDKCKPQEAWYAEELLAVELTKTIEMDEKLLKRMKEEKSLETAGVRLDQIESNIVSQASDTFQ